MQMLYFFVPLPFDGRMQVESKSSSCSRGSPNKKPSVNSAQTWNSVVKDEGTSCWRQQSLASVVWKRPLQFRQFNDVLVSGGIFSFSSNYSWYCDIIFEWLYRCGVVPARQGVVTRLLRRLGFSCRVIIRGPLLIVTCFWWLWRLVLSCLYSVSSCLKTPLRVKTW